MCLVRSSAIAIAVAVPLHGCTSEVGRGSASITNPTGSGLPPSMSTMVVDGSNSSGGDAGGGCHAVLIAPRIALTAAHCFEEIDPLFFGSIELFDQTITIDGDTPASWEEVVTFHPNAWGSSPPHPWTSPKLGANAPSDLAVVRLPSPAASSFTPARLWNPPGPIFVDFTGAEVVVGGHDGGNFSVGVTGVQVLNGLVDLGGSHVLEGQSQPSSLQPGDSGGGAFLTPSIQFAGDPSASSGPLSTPCAAAVGGATDEQVLVGIASSGAGTDWWAPTFLWINRSWIAQMTVLDEDGDGRCDDQDNCVADYNPGQENCNALAESTSSWGSSGVALGDVCDPVPCSYPDLATTGFTGEGIIVPWSASGQAICFAELGRSIDDRLLRTPALEEGAPAIQTATASVRYCDCRDANGDPITDPAACALPPNNCRLDPLELLKPEGGGSDSPALVSYWHTIRLAAGGAPVSQPTPMTYVDGGAPAEHDWDYVADFSDWVAAGWFTQPPVDPYYGAGTDLAGVMWTHDSTTSGAAAHGCSGCSLADGHVYALAPDPRIESVRCREIPQYKPAPWWTYCAVCDDHLSSLHDQVVNPVITVSDQPLGATQWLEGRARDVSGAIGESLLAALIDDDLLFAAPSEPIDVAGYRGAPRAIAVDVRRGAVTGQVLAGPGGFALAPLEGELGAVDVSDGVAASLSLRARTVFVVGGRRLHALRVGESQAMLVELGAPLEGIRAATFAGRSGRLWVLGAARGRFALHRIDVGTGAVTSQPLGDLDGYQDAWLTTAADGAVVITASGERGHAVWRAADQPAVTLRAVAAGEEPVVMAPSVAGASLHLALERGDGRSVWIEPKAIEISTNEQEGGR